MHLTDYIISVVRLTRSTATLIVQMNDEFCTNEALRFESMELVRKSADKLDENAVCLMEYGEDAFSEKLIDFIYKIRILLSTWKQFEVLDIRAACNSVINSTEIDELRKMAPDLEDL